LEKLQAFPFALNECERLVAERYVRRGCTVLRTGVGSDLLVVCKPGRPFLVEVKRRGGRLSRLQLAAYRAARSAGVGYLVESCRV